MVHDLMPDAQRLMDLNPLEYTQLRDLALLRTPRVKALLVEWLLPLRLALLLLTTKQRRTLGPRLFLLK